MTTNWIALGALVFSAVWLGFAIANIIYYDQLRNGDSGSITNGSAQTMYWLNLVGAILSAIILIWAIYEVLKSSNERLVPPTQVVTGQPQVPQGQVPVTQVVTAQTPTQIQTSTGAARVVVSPTTQRSVVSTEKAFTG